MNKVAGLHVLSLVHDEQEETKQASSIDSTDISLLKAMLSKVSPSIFFLYIVILLFLYIFFLFSLVKEMAHKFSAQTERGRHQSCSAAGAQRALMLPDL